MIFRIDDISMNTDMAHLRAIVAAIDFAWPSSTIMLAVSPLVHRMGLEPPADRERAFPRIMSAMSDHRGFFRVNHLGLPHLSDGLTPHRSPKNTIAASHGLWHVDHRLLSRDVQEASIVTSCSLVGAATFVPPFNKWNRDTEAVCREHSVELVKFEDGWRHVKYNAFDPRHERYYLHTHDVSAEWMRGWLATKGATE